ncbi:MAG: hypothetical protein ACRDQY_15030 [Pseudonocardiaceae bacterium]
MPTPTPQPDSTAVALCDIPLLDAEGTEIPLGSRVEQVAVNEAHGALRSRLHHHGDVTGRGRQLVYVCFDHEWRMTSLRSVLVRLVSAPETAVRGGPLRRGRWCDG